MTSKITSYVYDVCVYDPLFKGFQFCDQAFFTEDIAHKYAKRMIREHITVTADVVFSEDGEIWHTITRYGRKNPYHRKSRR